MANTRIVLTNYVDAGTIKNGSGGGAPALDETSPFTMTRTQNGDRRSLWKTSSAGPTFYYDIDLGSTKGVSVGALLGFTTLPTDGDQVTITVQYAAAYYPGAWNTFGTTGAQFAERDMGVVNAGTTSARYWRFVIATTASTGITLGRVLLGNATTYDLGGIHSPGGISSPFQNRIEQALEDGSYNLNTLGFMGRDFTLPFNNVTSAVRNRLLLAAEEAGSIVLVDAEDDVYEVIVTGGRCNVARNTDTLFNVSLEMKRLP